jgi:hypothetical protein
MKEFFQKMQLVFENIPNSKINKLKAVYSEMPECVFWFNTLKNEITKIADNKLAAFMYYLIQYLHKNGYGDLKLNDLHDGKAYENIEKIVTTLMKFIEDVESPNELIEIITKAINEFINNDECTTIKDILQKTSNTIFDAYESTKSFFKNIYNKSVGIAVDGACNVVQSAADKTNNIVNNITPVANSVIQTIHQTSDSGLKLAYSKSNHSKNKLNNIITNGVSRIASFYYLARASQAKGFKKLQYVNRALNPTHHVLSFKPQKLGESCKKAAKSIKDGTTILCSEITGSTIGRSIKQVLPVCKTMVTYPAKTLSNLAATVTQRQCKKLKYDENYVDEFMKFVDGLECNKIIADQMEFKEWLDTRKWIEQKKLKANKGFFGSDSGSRTRSVFNKMEVNIAPENKPGRLVCSSPSDVQCTYGPFLSKVLCHEKEQNEYENIKVCCGYNRTELGKIFQQCRDEVEEQCEDNEEVVTMTGDYSKFDSTIHKKLLDIEMKYYEKISPSDYNLI